MKKVALAAALITSVITLTACKEETEAKAGIDPKIYTDSLFAVMKADRSNYTKLIIKRLGPAGANAIAPKEHWQDLELTSLANG